MIKNVPLVMSFQKRFKTFDFTCSFNDGFNNAIKSALYSYVFVCLLEQASEFHTQTITDVTYSFWFSFFC